MLVRAKCYRVGMYAVQYGRRGSRDMSGLAVCDVRAACSCEAMWRGVAWCGAVVRCGVVRQWTCGAWQGLNIGVAVC